MPLKAVCVLVGAKVKGTLTFEQEVSTIFLLLYLCDLFARELYLRLRVRTCDSLHAAAGACVLMFR